MPFKQKRRISSFKIKILIICFLKSAILDWAQISQISILFFNFFLTLGYIIPLFVCISVKYGSFVKMGLFHENSRTYPNRILRFTELSFIKLKIDSYLKNHLILDFFEKFEKKRIDSLFTFINFFNKKKKDPDRQPLGLLVFYNFLYHIVLSLLFLFLLQQEKKWLRDYSNSCFAYWRCSLFLLLNSLLIHI